MRGTSGRLQQQRQSPLCGTYVLILCTVYLHSNGLLLYCIHVAESLMLGLPPRYMSRNVKKSTSCDVAMVYQYKTFPRQGKQEKKCRLLDALVICQLVSYET